MLENLKKLVAFKTITGDFDKNENVLDWIIKKVKKYPVHTEKLKSNNYSSLIITTQKTKEPIIWLAAHLDVVPGPDEIFIPRIEKNILYGRGAYDMKFAIACYLKLLKELNENLIKYNFGLLITTDEEIGGYNGTKYILEKGFNAKACFLPDGSGIWKFEEGAKGSWKLLVQCKGKSVHSSRPWLGDNAISKLVNFLHILEKEFTKEPCNIRHHYHRTLSISKISGGESSNKVADFAEALIDIRMNSENSKSELEKKIDSIKNNFSGVKIKEISFKNSYKNNLNNYYFKLFSSIAYKELKIKTSSIFSHGSSDACFFAKKKIPTILIQPKGGGHHSNKEWVDLKDVEKFYLVLKKFIQIVAKK